MKKWLIDWFVEVVPFVWGKDRLASSAIVYENVNGVVCTTFDLIVFRRRLLFTVRGKLWVPMRGKVLQRSNS